MIIREATKEDLPRIMELGREFQHLMLYQKDVDIMEKYLPRILVAEEELPVEPNPIGIVASLRVVGYYHYIVSGDPGFEEMLKCYRQFPRYKVEEATFCKGKGELCVIMQGACHRDVAKMFYEYLMKIYPEIWVYCSIKSRRPETYKELGFIFNPEEQYTFFNVSKGDHSTYQLGRWKK